MWLNVGTGLSRRLWLLEFEELCQKARNRTHLEDFGDPPLEPALPILLGSLEEEAELTPLGRYLMRVHLRDLLETRLRLTALWKQHPSETEAAPVERPLFITGMPRSGSTFLHELLAVVPGCRAPRVWEVMFPVPRNGNARHDQLARIRKTGACLWWFRRLAPGADAVYPMRATTPHECVAIHGYTFISEEFASTCDVPSYERFLRETDLSAAYQWEKRFLQHLQAEAPGKRWILKSPDHVHGLEALFQVFPDAVIVQTRRNPKDVLESSAALTLVLRDLYGTAGAPEEIRAREERALAEGSSCLARFRESHPGLAGRFIDVEYKELVAEPVATVARICEHRGIPFTAQAGEIVARLASSRSRYRRRPTRVRTGARRRVPVASELNWFARLCSRVRPERSEPVK